MTQPNPYNQYYQPPPQPNVVQPQAQPAPYPGYPAAPVAAPPGALAASPNGPYTPIGGAQAWQQPQPAFAPQFQQPLPPAQGGGYSLNQAAQAPDDLTLLPRTPGSYIVAVLNYQLGRNSQSQGSFGGLQNIATFQFLRSSDPKFPPGTQGTKIWRAGQPGNSGRGYGVVKDAKRQQQFVAAVYGYDPTDMSNDWDALSQQLAVRNWQQQPCVLELRLSPTNRPVKDRHTMQPTGEFWQAELFLPAPPPTAA